MATIAIELNDSGLTVARDGEVVLESPAVALLEDRITVGVSADRRARLMPDRINDVFWARFDRAPLERPSPHANSHADLAHRHLQHVWERVSDGCDGVVFAVPASLGTEGLALLLGIARDIGMPVVGLVDGAVAASESRAGWSGLHVDLHLDRCLLTALAFGPAVTFTGHRSDPELGWRALRAAWIKLLAELFVRKTRFDPLHFAESEQALHDLLPGLLAQLGQRSQAGAELHGAGERHSVVIHRDQLRQSADARYRRLAAKVDSTRSPDAPLLVSLSARAAALPGLAAELSALPRTDVVTLAPGAAALGALARESEIRSPADAARLVVELAASGSATDPGRARGADSVPTHVLHRSRAHALSGEPIGVDLSSAPDDPGLRLTWPAGHAPCVIHRSAAGVVAEPRGDRGVFVNGAKVAGSRELLVGDRVGLEGTHDELELVAVEEGREAQT